jgi:hypothetical protein
MFAIFVVQNKTTKMEDETQSKEGDGDALRDAPKSGIASRAGTSGVSYFLSTVFIIFFTLFAIHNLFFVAIFVLRTHLLTQFTPLLVPLATPRYPQELLM